MDNSLLRQLQDQVYCSQNNYKIEYSDSSKRDCVAVYFSSNAIFYPNEECVFRKTILERDRYEFQRMKIQRANKHVFVRDIYKNWYLSGINSNTNTIDKLVDLIRKETSGYKETVVCGISGGGYISVIVGSKINADIILCLDGQWILEIENESLENLFSQADPELKKYGNIAKEEYNNPNVFYLVSVFSKDDKKHLGGAEKLKNIHIIRFVNTHHGVPFLKPALPVVLNMNRKQLCSLERIPHFPILFEIRYAGVCSTFRYLKDTIVKRLKTENK